MNKSRFIKIKLENYQNVVKQLQSLYPTTFPPMVIFTQCKFLGTLLKQTEKRLITNDYLIEANEEICIEFNNNDLQSLISSPLIFIILVETIETDNETISSASSEDVLERTVKDTSTQTINCRIFGSYLVDLAPVILGLENYKELIIIGDNEGCENDASRTGVNIEITIEPPFKFCHKPNLLTLTIESIFNLPKHLSEEGEYLISVQLPFINTCPTIFRSNTYKYFSDFKIVEVFKKWLNFNEIYAKNETKFRISGDVEHIKNYVNIDLKDVFESECLRIEFNLIERYLVLYENFLKFTDYVENNGALILDIYFIKENEVQSLHFTSTIDLKSLLSPAVTSTRIAAPLYVYDERNFRQSSNRRRDLPPDQNNSKNLFKFIQETPETDQAIYNENGQPTFIVIEIDLIDPMKERRRLDDLCKELETKTIDDEIKQQLINETLKEILNEIIEKYNHYVIQRQRCICNDKSDFLTYLRRIGCYQNIVYLLTQIILRILQNDINDDDDNSQFIQQFGEDIFYEILKEFNFIMKDDVETKTYFDRIRFYAQQAIDLYNHRLASKYLLELIVENENDPNTWLNYGILQIFCDEKEKAYTCIEKALCLNDQNRLSLLIKSLLLSDREQIEEAKECFSLLLERETEWVEGWGVYCLFNRRTGNNELAELCQENAKNNMEHPQINDACLEGDDLIWTITNLPNSPFLRTCILLIKLNMFEWAEEALALETEHINATHYLLGVIYYFKQQYADALRYLEASREMLEDHTALLSLIGHCYYHLENYEEAHKYYLPLIDLEENPNYLHLVYFNLAKIYQELQEPAKARKILLLACKRYPTAYVWLILGKLYYFENDFISAEECFIESLMYDNYQSETWTLLNLINLKMCRREQAEICEQIAIIMKDAF